MASRNDMIERLEEDLSRDATSDRSAIEREIDSAIQTYSDQPFRFNEARVSFYTTEDLRGPYDDLNIDSGVASGNSVTLSRVFDIHGFTVTGNYEIDEEAYTLVGSQISEALEINSLCMLARDNFTGTGVPRDWAYDSGALYLDPIPSDIYKLSGRATFDINKVCIDEGIDSGSNPWYNEAEEMVRLRALGNLYSNYVHNEARAKYYWSRADEEFRRLIVARERVVSVPVTPWF